MQKDYEKFKKGFVEHSKKLNLHSTAVLHTLAQLEFDEAKPHLAELASNLQTSLMFTEKHSKELLKLIESSIRKN